MSTTSKCSIYEKPWLLLIYFFRSSSGSCVFFNTFTLFLFFFKFIGDAHIDNVEASFCGSCNTPVVCRNIYTPVTS